MTFIAGRSFTTYLDDVPVMLKWNDGRIAEVSKEDPLYSTLGECTTSGIQYIPALIIKANDNYCFYGNNVQVDDVSFEYERLKLELENFNKKKSNKFNEAAKKFNFAQLSKIRPQTKSETKLEEPMQDLTDEY